MRSGIRWHSSDTNVVRVGPPGSSARSAGQAEIVATGFSQERRASVVVDPRAEAAGGVPPAQPRAPFRCRFARPAGSPPSPRQPDSNPIPEARITWELSDTSVAAFDRASKGVLTPRALGTTTLTARLAGIEPAVWTVQVIPGTLELQPAGWPGAGRARNRQRIPAGRTGQDGGPGSLESRSDKPDVALVREAAVIDGLSPGRAVITATAAWGKSAKAEYSLLVTSWTEPRWKLRHLPDPRATGRRPPARPSLQDSATNIQPAVSPRIALGSPSAQTGAGTSTSISWTPTGGTSAG